MRSASCSHPLAVVRNGDFFDFDRFGGSAATIAIWIAVLFGRLSLRFMLPGSLPIVALDQNAASLALVTTAFAVLAVIFANAI